MRPWASTRARGEGPPTYNFFVLLSLNKLKIQTEHKPRVHPAACFPSGTLFFSNKKTKDHQNQDPLFYVGQKPTSYWG